MGTRRSIESDINKKIIRLKENQQPQGIFFYAIKNLEDGHYRVKIHCTDKAGNVMEAERNSETDKCIDDGWYESPIYTVDTVSPIITEVFCDQYPVRKKKTDSTLKMLLKLLFVYRKRILIKLIFQ